MPNRFDVFMSRIETKSARSDAPPPHPAGNKYGANSNKADAKPVRAAEAFSDKNNVKHRNKHNA
ncbi:hypothetical protein ASD50_14110 [Mesorhizobium sp. Root552]|uniref:hypothetical protein n=1 Tax=Mesorhizobium sp. Root552 TaxID=1736555 RepID=UPI0006FBD21A|nr:hypothetical protein ASD50_14110 [Mesorhizobium sp. Root552]